MQGDNLTGKDDGKLIQIPTKSLSNTQGNNSRNNLRSKNTTASRNATSLDTSKSMEHYRPPIPPWFSQLSTTLLTESGRHRLLIFLENSNLSSTCQMLAIQIDRFGKGIMDAGYITGLGKADVTRALACFADADLASWTEITRAEGLTMAARGIMASTIAREELPPSMERGMNMLPQLDEVLLATCDIYTCPTCGHTLPPSVQMLCMEEIQQNAAGLLMFCQNCRPGAPTLPVHDRHYTMDEDYLRALMLTTARQLHHALYHVNVAITRWEKSARNVGGTMEKTGSGAAEEGADPYGHIENTHALCYRLKSLILFRLDMPDEAVMYMERARDLETAYSAAVNSSTNSSVLEELTTTAAKLLHPRMAMLSGL